MTAGWTRSMTEGRGRNDEGKEPKIGEEVMNVLARTRLSWRSSSHVQLIEVSLRNSHAGRFFPEVGEERCAEIPFTCIGKDGHDELSLIFSTSGDLAADRSRGTRRNADQQSFR